MHPDPIRSHFNLFKEVGATGCQPLRLVSFARYPSGLK